MEKDDISKLIDEKIKSSQKDALYQTSNYTYHTHNNIDSPILPFTSLGGVPNSFVGHPGDMLLVNSTANALNFFTGFFTVAKDTNSTTPVNVFGASGAPFALIVTGVYLVSKDTTAGNITLKQAANTVATIAKGTTSGAMVGAVSLANTTYALGDVCTVVSSSAGNATVFITFTT